MVKINKGDMEMIKGRLEDKYNLKDLRELFKYELFNFFYNEVELPPTPTCSDTDWYFTDYVSRIRNGEWIWYLKSDIHEEFNEEVVEILDTFGEGYRSYIFSGGGYEDVESMIVALEVLSGALAYFKVVHWFFD